jgi:anti-sigma factor RsiW
VTSSTCLTPVPLHDLIDYAIGELPAPDQDLLEAHVFSCEGCSNRLESVYALGTAIAASVAQGPTSAAVSARLLETIGRRGARVRQYHLVPGGAVACTVAPYDDFVAVHLEGMPEGVTDLAVDVDFLDHTAGASRAQHREGVPVDVTTRAAVMLFPASLIRTYPRSRWTMTVRGQGTAGAGELGPFLMEHTPWDERPL